MNILRYFFGTLWVIFAADPMSRKVRAWFLLLLLLWARPAAATDNYSYRAGEYATISGGRSPDGRWSIAAHGGGPYGDDDFDLYLMREPAHEKLRPLRTRYHLDTGPLSIVGLWAPDSSRVVVLNRADRHILDLRLFAVAGGKVQPIDVPSLVSTISQQHLKPGVRSELSSRFYRVTWQKPDRLTLEEFDVFDAAEPIFSDGLEAYLTVERVGAKRTFTDFSAAAMCEITKKGKLRLLGVKPLWKWPRTIVYSPHLRYDRQGGLHDTETTASALAAQKDRE
jgi:hypothetical protein